MATDITIHDEPTLADSVPEDPQEMNVLIRQLLKRWKLLLVVGFIAGVAGIVYASMQDINYESRLSFALDAGENDGMSGALSLAAQFGLNIGGGKDIFAGDNIVEIMKSRRMVEKVLLSADTIDNKPYSLIEYYVHVLKAPNKKTEDVHYPLNASKETLNYKQDSVLYAAYNELIKEAISAQKPDRKLNIYEVRITSTSEKFSKDFTDRLVKETNNFYVEICSKKARETLQILEDRVATMKGNVNSSISSKASSQDANVNPAFAAAQVPVQKQQVNIQVYSTAYAEMFKNLELARYQYLKQVPLMQIIDNADYPMKKIKKNKLITGILFSSVALILMLIILSIKVTLFPERRFVARA